MRARRVGFAVVACLLALAGLEGVGRLVEPGLSARTMPLPFPMATRDRGFEAELAAARARAGSAVPLVSDESGSWTLPPSRTERYADTVMRYNALGMRGPDWGPAAPGERRIFTLGDSSIMGLGVMEEQVFSSVAADTLAERCGCVVNGVIGGIPGYTTGQALALQARVEARLQPTWVVIGALWSDVLREGTAATVTPTSRWATYRVATLLLAPWLPPGQVRFLDRASDVSDARHAARTPLADYAANLRAMAAKASADGARVAFLTLPAPMDLDRAPAPDNVAAYRAAMRDVAAGLGAPLVDGPALARARGATLAWWTDQVHPSSLGHRELGLALADALDE